MRRRLSYVVVAVVGYLAVAGLCYGRWGKHGLFGALVNGVICIPPTALALLMGCWTIDRPRVEQLAATLAGMFFRVVAAVGIGLAVFYMVPFFREPGHEYGYWGSMLIVFLYTLAAESILLSSFKAADICQSDAAR